MLPVRDLRLALGELIAADTHFLAPAVTANKVFLVMASFTPNENLTTADFTKATFDGSAAIAGTTGDQETGIDPATQQQIVTMVPPVGGWRWKVTGTTNLPQTIYGAIVTKSDGTTLLGMMALTTPVTLNGIDEIVDIGEINFTIVPQPIS